MAMAQIFPNENEQTKPRRKGETTNDMNETSKLKVQQTTRPDPQDSAVGSQGHILTQPPRDMVGKLPTADLTH